MRNSSLEVHSIGEAALDWLSADPHGEVVAAVSHAVYLRTDQNKMFWLAEETSPMHRRCLQVSPPIPRMNVGSPYEVRNHSLVTNSGVGLNFSRSPIWKEPTLPLGKAVAITSLPELLTPVYGYFSDCPTSAGWGRLIPSIMELAKCQSSSQKVSQGNILPSTAGPAVEGIIRACLAHDFRRVLERAADLVGLGEGLTPSGDDFLGGLFFCLRLLHNTYPEIPYLTTWPYPDFILKCEPLTNRISFALLKDHAEGHALEPLHYFANALLAGQSVNRLLPFAGELVDVGHSTGWDLLTGFLAGMSVTFAQ